jgi:hypothetical protein
LCLVRAPEILGFCMILFCLYVPVVSLAFLLVPR